MITGCFRVFTIQARAKPPPPKVCLHHDALTFNTAGTIQNPNQLVMDFFSTRWARWSVICGLIWVWINLFKRGGKKLNKNTNKKTHTKAFLESIATSKSVQTKPHQHLQV